MAHSGQPYRYVESLEGPKSSLPSLPGLNGEAIGYHYPDLRRRLPWLLAKDYGSPSKARFRRQYDFAQKVYEWLLHVTLTGLNIEISTLLSLAEVRWWIHVFSKRFSELASEAKKRLRTEDELFLASVVARLKTCGLIQAHDEFVEKMAAAENPEDPAWLLKASLDIEELSGLQEVMREILQHTRDRQRGSGRHRPMDSDRYWYALKGVFLGIGNLDTLEKKLAAAQKRAMETGAGWLSANAWLRGGSGKNTQFESLREAGCLYGSLLAVASNKARMQYYGKVSDSLLAEVKTEFEAEAGKLPDGSRERFLREMDLFFGFYRGMARYLEEKPYGTRAAN